MGCIVFCLLEIIINSMEHVPNLYVLLLGRVLGGISTCLLFSSFETWMVAEHRRRGFSDESLQYTFSVMSWGNGAMAIVAGFVAQWSYHHLDGDIGPFKLAVALSLICLLMILMLWSENYGAREDIKDNNRKDEQPVQWSVWKLLKDNRAVVYVGLSQAIFEGAVYTFGKCLDYRLAASNVIALVFMWVPVLLLAYGDQETPLPTGLVFSCLMLAMCVGGTVFPVLTHVVPSSNNRHALHWICVIVYVLAGISMIIPLIWFSFGYILNAFLLLEISVGLFNACSGTMRSMYYDEAHQSTITSIFRVPLNVLVVLGTLLTNYSSDNQWQLQRVFAVLVILHGIALLLQVALILDKTISHKPKEL